MAQVIAHVDSVRGDLKHHEPFTKIQDHNYTFSFFQDFRAAKLPWIFPEAPRTSNGSVGNIQGNIDRFRTLSHVFLCILYMYQSNKISITRCFECFFQLTSSPWLKSSSSRARTSDLDDSSLTIVPSASWENSIFKHAWTGRPWRSIPYKDTNIQVSYNHSVAPAKFSMATL